MKIDQKLKEALYMHLLQSVDQQIKTAEDAIASAKESRDSDTKSSVGDKYETGRAMMQNEMDRYKVQLSKAVKLKADLSEINLKKNYDSVQFGSLVQCNTGVYFISIGLGKIMIDDQSFYAISMAAPLGKALASLTTGNKFTFQNQEHVILSIK